MRETNGRAAIEAVDQVVWEAVTASGDLVQGPQSGLARLLRESAAAALAGVHAACREDTREAGLARLEAALDELRRLGTWLDLAERFGDLAADRVLDALEAQGRAMSAVDELRAAWRGAPAGEVAEPAPEYATVEVSLPATAAA